MVIVRMDEGDEESDGVSVARRLRSLATAGENVGATRGEHDAKRASRAADTPLPLTTRE